MNVTAFSKRQLRYKLGFWTSCKVGLECREENRPYSGEQHQAHSGLNPALGVIVKDGGTNCDNFFSRTLC